jgi:hypothetical protein
VFENTGRLEKIGQKLIKDVISISYSDKKSIGIVCEYWLHSINLCFWKCKSYGLW